MRASLRKYQLRENGFTLIELLIVVLIIGVLAAIAIPVYLGLQSQGKNSATRQDVNSAVHSIQVALTEGQAVSAAASANTDTANRSDGTQVVTTVQNDNKNYTVVGTQNDTQFTYTYDSTTGKFTEGTANIVLGGGGNVAPAITSATPTNTGQVGVTYSYYVVATGTPAPTYTATGLPTGLTINSTTGRIYGSPTTAAAYTYTVTASNGTTPNATQSGTITINPANSAPAITSATPTATATVGTAYSYTVTASGYPAPTFSVASGSLPTGLTLDSTTGILAGTPTVAQTANFTITANNAAGTSAPQTASITVSPAAAPSLVNYDFESGTQGWTAATNGAANTSTVSDSGSNVLKIQQTSAATYVVAYPPGQTYTLTPNKSYTYSGRVRIVTTNPNVSVFLEGWGSHDSITTKNVTWTNLSVTWTQGANSSTGGPTVVITDDNNNSFNNTVLYIDDIKLVQNN